MSREIDKELLNTCKAAKIDAVEKLFGQSATENTREQSEFQNTCKAGKIDVVEKCIGQGAKENIRDQLELLYARKAAKINTVEKLITQGPKENTRDQLEKLNACKEGKIDVVEKLVGQGTKENTIKRDQSELLYERKAEEINTVEKLITQGPKENTGDQLELLNACKAGQIDVVEKLITQGANVNAGDQLGRAPLHLAALYGHNYVLLHVLDKGGDPNLRDKSGWTPLHFAAEFGRDKILSILLLNGAHPNATSDAGWTPLHLTAKYGNTHMLIALLSAGGDPNLKDEAKCTPLHWAARKGHVRAVITLLSNGADSNSENNCRQTPLHIAAENGHESITTALHKNGGNLNLKDSSGDTPLHLAAKGGHLSVISSLISLGAQTDQKDNIGDTPLHLAAKGGHLSVISSLISHGAQTDPKNYNGYTPLHLAAIFGSRNATLTLLKHGALLFETDSKGMTAMELAQKYYNRSVSKLYKRILQSGLPKELLYLKTQDSNTFTSNLRSGYYLSYSGKIMTVGHEAVGKTAITTKLRGLKPSTKRQSTEGLDLHIYKAAIDIETKQWVSKALDMEDLAFRDLLSKPKIPSAIYENISEDDQFDEENTEDSKMNEISLENQHHGTYLDTKSGRQEYEWLGINTPKESSLFRRIKAKLGLEKASINTIEEIQEEAVRRGKKGLVDDSFAPINMMDFGGQTVFYSTHQTFLTYRGLYILVLDGSKGFDEELNTEMFIPGLHGKPTSRKFTLFWVGSIESFSTGTSDSFPKILVVCTHKDKVPKDEVDQRVNAIFTEIEKMYEGTSTLKHLVLEHRIFLNALDPEEPEYDRLKNVLVELVCSQPTWGEKLPKAWIHLKLMINRSVEKGEAIMTMKQFRDVNRENPVQVLSDEDLRLFLTMQHAQGEIIYFPITGLRDKIVISPSFLVGALRSLVTDTTFATGHRCKTLGSMNRNGLLKQNDIFTIWKDNKQVLQHKHYILQLLEHLAVIASPRNYNKTGAYVKPDFYYVPSLVKITDDTCSYFQGCDSKVLGLSFRFQSKILPPVIGYRLIASCVDMFEIKNDNGQILLFSGLVVLKVKRGLDIALFLRPARVDLFLVHAMSRFQIVRDTASGIAECLKDILKSILENYKASSLETKESSGMPYTIEYPCFNCLSPCYTNSTDDWICDHGHDIAKESKEMWKTNSMVEVCTAECKGLIGPDLDEPLTDLHLAKVAQQFNWNDLYKLLIRLELSVKEIKAFQDDYGSNALNVAFLCLRKWRMRKNGTVGDLVTAMRDMDLDVHAACKMVRNRPMAELNIPMKEPTDQLLDSIANEAITESLFLSIELGHSASLWLQMKDDKEKIVKINRTVLREWKSAHPRKDQMKDLAQALCNVGLNISTFIQDMKNA